MFVLGTKKQMILFAIQKLSARLFRRIQLRKAKLSKESRNFFTLK